MARLTRQGAQVRTREHLLGAATEHFLGHGYAAASLEQIAEDAGYSKGPSTPTSSTRTSCA